jgi:hypothetical protein
MQGLRALVGVDATPLDKAALLKAVDQAHHVGAFDAEGPGKLALTHAGTGLDQPEDRIVDRPDGEVPERLPEILEDQDLRQPQAIADDAGERRLVDAVPPAGRAGLPWGPVFGQSVPSLTRCRKAGFPLPNSGI